MDVKKKRKYQLHSYSQADLESALRDVKQKGKSIGKVAKEYNIPKSTLHAKCSDKVPLECRKGPSSVLTNEEENRLVAWIIDKARLGFPMHHEEVKDAVESILNAAGRKTVFVNNRPGNKWLKLFLRRHPEVKRRNTDVISKARASVTEEKIREWHRDVRIYLEAKGQEDVLNRPESIFNGDETAVELAPKTGKVLGPAAEKNLYEISPGKEKETLTVLCSFNAAGSAVPPMIMYPYVRIPSHLAESLPKGWAVGRSESGWMVAGTFYEYIANVFYCWCVKSAIPFPVVYFMDGHKSHLTLELSEFCSQHGIILCALPPNATHIMQPCDVSIFRGLKIKWRQVVREHKKKTQKSITKTTFAPLFEKAFNQITEDSITNGFKCCGLYPFNEEAINYSKCISTRRQDLNSTATSSNTALSDEDFQSAAKFLKYVLGENKINEFLAIKNSKIPCSDHVYKLWEQCIQCLKEEQEEEDQDCVLKRVNNLNETDECTSNLDLQQISPELDQDCGIEISQAVVIQMTEQDLSVLSVFEENSGSSPKESAVYGKEVDILSTANAHKDSFMQLSDLPVIDVSTYVDCSIEVSGSSEVLNLEKQDLSKPTRIIKSDEENVSTVSVTKPKITLNNSAEMKEVSSDAISIESPECDNADRKNIAISNTIPHDFWKEHLNWPSSELDSGKKKSSQMNFPRVAIGSDLLEYQKKLREEQETKRLGVIQRAAERKIKKEEKELLRKQIKEEKFKKKKEANLKKDIMKKEALELKEKKKAEAEAKKVRIKSEVLLKRKDKENTKSTKRKCANDSDTKSKRKVFKQLDFNRDLNDECNENIYVLDLSKPKECDNYYSNENVNLNEYKYDENCNELGPIDFSNKV